MVSESGSVERRAPVSEWQFELLYDGECPLCAREVALLRRLDRRERIDFVDLTADGFDPAPYGRSAETLMREIHGRLPSGELVVGVEVFRRAYAAVGLAWLVAPTRWPLLRPLSEALYRVFARWRFRRRFPDGVCERCVPMVPGGESH